MKFLEGKLVKFKSNINEGELLVGYVDTTGTYANVYYGLSRIPIDIRIDRIVEVYDLVVHEPKEDKLTVAQEASNFGYQAIQGIISANEDKESQKHDVPQKKIPFTFSDFDTSVKRTWKDQTFKDAVSNASLGLTGEAGEVADLIKKAIYHGRGFANDVHPSEKAIKFEDVKDELSDVLFYVSAMAQEFGFTLEEVARHNKEKLEKRYEKGFTVEESAQKRDKLSFPRNMIVKNPTKYYKKFAIVHVTGETDTHYLSGEVKIPKEVF